MEIWKNGDRVKTPEGDELLLQGGKWVPVQVGPISSVAINFLDKGVQNALNTPAIIESGLDAAAGGLASGVHASIGSIVNLAKGQDASFGQKLAESRERFAAAESQTIPRFGDMRNIGEDIRTLIQTPFQQGDVGSARQTVQTQKQQAQELFPGFSSIGDFGADAAALLVGRKPIAKERGRQAAKNIDNAEEFLKNFRASKSQLDPRTQDALDDVATKAFKKLKRGGQNIQSFAVKGAEASIEGAYLAALNNEDPLISAATSAGTQAVGSLGLFLSTNPRTALLPAIATSFAVHELWKTFAPGDQNFFESKDFAFQMTASALALGVLGGMTGSGRLGPSAAKAPLLADAITAVPRAVAENLFRQLRDNRQTGNLLPEQVMERLGSNPEFFNKNQINSLMRAQNSESEGAFTKEIDRLMRDSEDFRDRIQTLIEQRTPPEGAEVSGAIDPLRRLQLGSPTHQIIRN